MIFVKKALFFIGSTNLGLQPAVSLAKDVKTPNSVWGKTAAEIQARPIQKRNGGITTEVC